MYSYINKIYFNISKVASILKSLQDLAISYECLTHLVSMEAVVAPELFSLIVVIATRGRGWSHTCVSEVRVLEIQYVTTASLVRADPYTNLYVHIVALSVAVTQQE